MQVHFYKSVGFEDLAIPFYATAGAAGMDLLAAVESSGVSISPGTHALISCGFSMAIPTGFEAQIRPRSGLALKKGITVLNAPGTIDSDYRGEIGVILYNTSLLDFLVMRGDRIAQMIFASVCQVELVVVDSLSETDRGFSGYGSTGVVAQV